MNLEAYSALPTELRASRRYLPWRGQQRSNGSLGKVPCSPVGGALRPVDPLDARVWMTLGDAWRWVSAGRADGLGLCVDVGLGVLALDLDQCVTPDGTLAAGAGEVLRRFPGAYAELSPSGRGVHLLLPARCPSGWRRAGGVEILDRGFVTVTGQALHAPADWADQSHEIAAWHTERGSERPKMPRSQESRPTPARNDPSAEGLLHRAFTARNGDRFAALWRGERCGYPSASEGDLALVMCLLYWLGDPATDADVDLLFQQSGRMRPKWLAPSTAPGGSYRDRTLHRARQLRARRTS